MMTPQHLVALVVCAGKWMMARPIIQLMVMNLTHGVFMTVQASKAGAMILMPPLL